MKTKNLFRINNYYVLFGSIKYMNILKRKGKEREVNLLLGLNFPTIVSVHPRPQPFDTDIRQSKPTTSYLN